MKSYFDLEGDGGSNILDQVLDLKSKIKENLSQVKNMIAIGSGKGGVGKSTLTMQIAACLRHQGYDVSLLDADINGPCLARLSGLRETLLIPGADGLIVPKNNAGIGVISFGSVVPESESVEFASVAKGDSHVWRATKEFATLAQFLGDTNWGKLDFLLIDLPPGAERCFQFAEFFGSDTKFVLVTIPSELSQGVVLRSLAALKKTDTEVLGVIENMTGYYCASCNQVKPLFPTSTLLGEIPVLGKIPFDPELARICDQGTTIEKHPKSPATEAIYQTTQVLLNQIKPEVLRRNQ